MSANGYKPAAVHPELPPDKLRWRCEPSRLPFETTAQAELREGFIGQERALRALKMGVELPRRDTTCLCAGWRARAAAERCAHDRGAAPRDQAVAGPLLRQQFQDYRPAEIAFAAARAGERFKKDMQAGIDFLRRRIPQVFEGEPFQRQKGRIVERFTVREKELMDDFTRRIAREQFALGHMQVGAVALPEIFPVLEGQMVPIEDISKMVHEGKLDSPVAEEIERKYEQFRQEFTVVYRKTLTLSRELASELSYLEQEARRSWWME